MTRELAALLLPAALLLTGCLVAAGAAVGGTAAYVAGDLEARLEASPQRIVEAAKRVFEDMEVSVISADATGVDGQVIGRTALDRKIEVTTRRESETTSKIAIRVDTFGDEELSRQILEKIRAKL